MNPTVVKTERLGKSFPYFRFGPADFEAQAGTAVALVGKNGAGKSTFFRLLLRLYRPDDGTIHIFLQDLTQHEQKIKEKLGYAGGGMYDAFDSLTVQELAQLIRYWYPDWDESKYREMINKYDINEREKFAHCSTGIKKKVEFIFALAHHPRLLLLDEPFSGVDLVSKRKMQAELAEWMEDPDRCVIIATHQQDEIRSLCDYIWLLQDGKFIGHYEKDETLDRWARVWVPNLPPSLQNHPHVVHYETDPTQFVTDNLPVMETVLVQHGINPIRSRRLELDEMIECMLERTKAD